MKKIVCAIFFIVQFITLFNYSAYSQATLKLGVGYNFALLGGELNPYLNSMTYDPAYPPSVHTSWGKGGTFGVTFNYKFNKFIDPEFGVKYHYGSSVSYNDTVSDITNIMSDRFHYFVFSLGDIYNFGHSASFTPYAGAGVNFVVDNNISIVETSSDSYGFTTIFNSSLTCKTAFGGYGELGANYYLSPGFSFFGELRIDVLYLTPQKFYVNSETQNGGDISYTLLPYQRETDYVSGVTPSNHSSQLQPTEETVSSLPASSWGFNVGVAFNLGSKASTSSQKK